jgi:hypothetical protein
MQKESPTSGLRKEKALYKGRRKALLLLHGEIARREGRQKEGRDVL